VAIPATATQASLAFHLHINGSADARTSGTFKVSLLNASGSVLATLASYTSSQAASGYQLHSFDLSSYKGQKVTLSFTGAPGRSRHRSHSRASFVLDNVSLDCR
jgi:serine protease